MSRETPHDPTDLSLPPGGGLPGHRRPLHDFPAPLDVVTVISNPARFHTRYDLYRCFERYVAAHGARLTTVECAFGGRPFELTEAGNPRHLQVRTPHELWHKENMINLGVQTLPRDWQYVAWIDADVTFSRPDWVQETLHALQHYDLVQCFSHALDLGPEHQILQRHQGFAYSYAEGLPESPDGGYDFWHPGYAWAATRAAFDALGGLIDWAVLGSADHHMAKALIGRVRETVPGAMSAAYRDGLDRWEATALARLRRNIGYVPGLLLHHWHGKKRDRRYQSRWEILTQNQYDPTLDLKRDWQGLWQLTDRSPGLRDGIRRYFRQRNEDSLDVE